MIDAHHRKKAKDAVDEILDRAVTDLEERLQEIGREWALTSSGLYAIDADEEKTREMWLALEVSRELDLLELACSVIEARRDRLRSRVAKEKKRRLGDLGAGDEHDADPPG